MHENLAETLRQRIREFGSKPSYVLFPEELRDGIKQALFASYQPEDRGDGTIITRVLFEGHTFLCATEKK